MKTFILKYPDQPSGYVAIDGASGYPFSVKWYHAEVYTDFEKANDYAKHFGFVVCDVQAIINGVVVQE